MDWDYTIPTLVALAITGAAIYALRWSAKCGQWRDSAQGAASIFDEQEPVGQMTDRFPLPRRRKP